LYEEDVLVFFPSERSLSEKDIALQDKLKILSSLQEEFEELKV
jgi:hypothetical protein